MPSSLVREIGISTSRTWLRGFLLCPGSVPFTLASATFNGCRATGDGGGIGRNIECAPTLLHDLKVPEQVPKGLPAIVLLVIWIVMFNVIGRRERKNLRREMDELNDLDGGKLQRG
jgi:hypothetical protein